MSFSIDYERDGSGAVCVWSGIATRDEILAANEAIYAPQRLEKLSYQIWDFSAVQRIEATPEDLRMFVALDAQAVTQRPNLISAMVVPSDSFGGLEREYHVYLDLWGNGLASRHFESLAEARIWIDSQLAAQPATSG